MPPRLPFRPPLNLHPSPSSRGFYTTLSTTTSRSSSTHTCTCLPTNTDIPPIDHTTLSIANTTPNYTHHLLISTGKRDWKSRIEDDGVEMGWGVLGRGVKEGVRERALARGGVGEVEPNTRILITYSSFPPAFASASSNHNHNADTSDQQQQQTASALLLPQSLYIPHIPTSSTSAIENFLHSFLPPQTPSSPSISTHQIQDPIILICAHRSRDLRCGILGPILEAEFTSTLWRLGFEVSESLAREEVTRSEENGTRSGSGSGDVREENKREMERERESEKGRGRRNRAYVGLVSHVGGHKWAGNVIVYLPPDYRPHHYQGGTGKQGVLADNGKGVGIWYGRVEPRHVEEIIVKTVCAGRVLRELLRGFVGGSPSPS